MVIIILKNKEINNLHTIVEQTVVNLEQLHGGTYNLGDRLLLLKNTTEK